MKAFWVDLKKNILSPNFIISVLLMALLCLLADAPTVSAREPLSILDEIVKMRKEIWLEKGMVQQHSICNQVQDLDLS